jgi:phospholipase/carboxylesterase
VLEHGMPRFFRRLAEGVFDEADVRRRAEELADFVQAARAQYGIAAPVALGFSNGANIAAAMLLLRPEALAGAILLRAMVAQTTPVDLHDKPVLIVSGKLDPSSPPATPPSSRRRWRRLARTFSTRCCRPVTNCRKPI